MPRPRGSQRGCSGKGGRVTSDLSPLSQLIERIWMSGHEVVLPLWSSYSLRGPGRRYWITVALDPQNSSFIFHSNNTPQAPTMLQYVGRAWELQR